ncbi:alpha/beta fold hydrolase [Nonomuraea phyllanthi]|uniref:Alpha/beta fold hydrolase n=1 Tax=Nonomuraea phyllanthi TaxID=2219224 RepID=A0A5C4VMM9_9ACTN|nr:alpha/beta fold hydrolase [Nonomuraea phyllanthi]KAB8189553.1 alpha/beta fold hydrolase [Nonomuraea phyllanthi]
MTAGSSTTTEPATAASHTYRTEDVAVDGGTLRVGVWEPDGGAGAAGSGGTVLAVHGITASHMAWPDVVAALPGRRVIAPDLRGRGRSNGLGGPYGMARHADDLAAVVRALCTGPGAGEGAAASGGVPRPGRVTVVGHSMGGFVGLVLAHRHPDLVERLVLVDGGLPLPPVPGVPENATAEELLAVLLGPAAERLSKVYASREVYREFWRAHPAFADWTPTIEQYVDYDLDEVATGGATGPGETAGVAGFRPATSPDAVAGDSVDMTNGGDLVAALEALAAGAVGPVTLLRAPRGLMAEPGGLYPEAVAAGWAERIGPLTVRTVADVNHYSIIMSPAGVAAIAEAAR